MRERGERGKKLLHARANIIGRFILHKQVVKRRKISRLMSVLYACGVFADAAAASFFPFTSVSFDVVCTKLAHYFLEIARRKYASNFEESCYVTVSSNGPFKGNVHSEQVNTHEHRWPRGTVGLFSRNSPFFPSFHSPDLVFLAAWKQGVPQRGLGSFFFLFLDSPKRQGQKWNDFLRGKKVPGFFFLCSFITQKDLNEQGQNWLDWEGE